MKHYAASNYRDDIRGPTRDLTIFTRRLALSLVTLALAIVSAQELHAADAENCLMCHRFRGLARVDKEGAYRLFHVDETLFGRGPHARVTCTGCHADVDKIPHDDAEPVDCLRSCHIEEPTREIIFTHSKVQETLEDSVHALADQSGTPRDFPGDFPGCKDCHDIPLFRPVAMFKSVRSGVSERAVSRCLVCHSDENFIRYYYSHVTTRLHKARDPREVVTMCGTCHSDAALAKRHGLTDVVSSYLETYHGKAVLLGSSLAPDCLDCHARQGSVHEMHAATDPRSSVHPDNRAVTCQTQDCHSSAAPAFASFDVHATRDAKTHALEFGVGLFFVFVTLAVLLPVLTLSVLGLIRELFPSHQAEAEIERLTKLAEKKAEREKGIQRFTGAHRLQHALLVIVFVVLCLTGLPMKFPEASWSPAIYGLFGGIHGAPIVHRIAGVALLVGFALHGVLILLKVRRSVAKKRKRGLRVWINEILTLPMIPKWRDLGDLVALAKYVFFLSPKRPNYGHFSWKEKLEYLGLWWGIPLLGVTGILLWAESLSSHVLPGWVLNVAYLAHTYESLLAVAHIALVHIPGAIGRPGVSPLSSMILNGKITPRALAEEHGAEIDGWTPVKEVQL
ncbi:MAG: cytochrome b/b6 domain-containing protein [Phycisphaerales bacterium]|nr:MAG: cytochrome b/b6 domain-containing protein [Phycisphaerales bacterium]